MSQILNKIKGDHYIDGCWTNSSNNEKFSVINPANGSVLKEISIGTSEDVDKSVESAEQSYNNEWSKFNGSERGEFLYKWALTMEEYVDDIAVLDTIDNGKPLKDSKSSILRGIKMLKFFAGISDKLTGEQIPVGNNFLNYTLYEPYGVVGAIIPWNYPTTNFLTKVAPVLACGNTIVIKPAEQTPLSALMLAQLAVESGLPKGVVNVVNGLGYETGSALVAHPKVKKITFTGSTNTGLKLMNATDGNIKSFTLELGGKTANVVFSDADIDTSVKAAAFTCFMNQGQTCTAGTRLLLHEEIADKFIEKLISYVKTLKIGDPFQQDTKIGAIISESQYKKVLSFIEKGKKEGASLLYGGNKINPSMCRDGYFIEPTIFDDVTPEMEIFCDEIFGPVLSITRFNNFKEAIQLANSSEYGLAATVWTKDLQLAHKYAKGVDSGIVWINTVHALHPASPHGGYKQSGLGTEMGFDIMNEYMRKKSTWIQLDTWESPWE